MPRRRRYIPSSGGLRGFPRLMLLFVGVCLAAQVASVSHMVLVPHARCVEHGALEHTGAHEQATHARAVGVQVGADAARVVLRTASGAEDHGHDDCLACATRRKIALGAASAARVPSGALHTPARPLQQRSDPTRRATYRFAPKGSPPV